MIDPEKFEDLYYDALEAYEDEADEMDKSVLDDIMFPDINILVPCAGCAALIPYGDGLCLVCQEELERGPVDG